MRVIVCDIDGTVLDVEPRIAACLEAIGVGYESQQPTRVTDTLDRQQKDRFYNLFLSNEYLHLDEPIADAIERLRALIAETALPLVYLSGRLQSMTRPTKTALDAIGLPYEKLFLKPMRQRMRRTAAWKIATITENGYEPVHIFDDDAAVLAALGEAFPDAQLYDLSGRKSTPGGG